MYLASASKLPSTYVLLTLSEPAKSTKCSFETNQVSEVDSLPFGQNQLKTWYIMLKPSRVIVKTQWDLEELWFMGVALTYSTIYINAV